MTPRERYRAVVRGEAVDRLPYQFGGPRESTFAAWRRQGLSAEQQRRFQSWIGADPSVGFGKLDTRPIPAYGVLVLREDEAANEREWIDEWGVRRIDAIRQPTAGFATRRYLDFPVKCRADFEAMRFRYDPRTPERLLPVPTDNKPSYNPDGYRVHVATTAYCDPAHTERLNHGDAPTHLTVPGLFWTARDWTGFEGLCRLAVDEPACVEAMMAHWTEFLITLLDEPLDRVKIDRVQLNEDMAYKHASMFSPAMMRRFMLPHYQRLYEFFKAKGVDCVMMDTDGHLAQVLDVFYPTAIDGVTPVEIAAHNDPGEYLARYPGLVLEGGIDKRELRDDLPRARAEIVRRYRQAREFGRYLPAVDHGVPPDVPLRTFLYFVELARALANGADPETFEPIEELAAQLGEFEAAFDPLEAIARAERTE